VWVVKSERVGFLMSVCVCDDESVGFLKIVCVCVMMRECVIFFDDLCVCV